MLLLDDPWRHDQRWNVKRPHHIGSYQFYRLGIGRFEPPPYVCGYRIDGGTVLATGPEVIDGGTPSSMNFDYINGGWPWTEC